MAERNRALAIVPDDTEVASLADRVVPQWSKDVNKEQAIELARLALAYGLDPFLGELIPYQGKPYLTFDGRIRLADEHPAYDGYEHGPVLGDERAAFLPQSGEVIWKCTVFRRDRSRPTIAYGRAGGEKETNPVAKKDPATMAQKRAIHRALRAAFPVRMPGVVDDDPVTPAQLKAIHATDGEQGITVTERHEVLEATFGVSSSKDLTAAQAGSYLDERATQRPATPPKQEQPPIEVTARDADDIDARANAFLGSKKPSHYKATPEQIAEIKRLWTQSGATPEALDNWILQINKNLPIEGLTMERADAAIAKIRNRIKALGPVQAPADEPDEFLGDF